MMNPNQAQFGGSFQQPPQQPQQKGCLGRNWKWMLPVGCLGLIIGLVALVGGIFFAAMSAMKSSDVYQGALRAAQAHPAAVERLGEPIKDGWLVKGNVKFNAGAGSADFEIPVSGPKGSGTLYVSAVNPEGSWMYEKLDLAVAGGATVSLLDRNVAQPPPGTPVEVEGDVDVFTGEDEGEEAGEAETPPPADAQAEWGSVLNGKAISKPEPTYPALARAARASGVVTVHVTVDESGHVVSAEAVSGHPLLRPAAVAAARQARLTPTLLSGKPVKVSGVLTYNFVLEQ
jgi:TonB family protein